MEKDDKTKIPDYIWQQMSEPEQISYLEKSMCGVPCDGFLLMGSKAIDDLRAFVKAMKKKYSESQKQNNHNFYKK